MAIFISILVWLGFLVPGTYSQQTIDATISAHSAEIHAVQSDPTKMDQVGVVTPETKPNGEIIIP